MMSASTTRPTSVPSPIPVESAELSITRCSHRSSLVAHHSSLIAQIPSFRPISTRSCQHVRFDAQMCSDAFETDIINWPCSDLPSSNPSLPATPQPWLMWLTHALNHTNRRYSRPPQRPGREQATPPHGTDTHGVGPSLDSWIGPTSIAVCPQTVRVHVHQH
jgi:hypothetical protein